MPGNGGNYVMVRAFKGLAEKNAALSPEERKGQKFKIRYSVERIKNRGGRVVEDPIGHRLTQGATGPVVGGPLFPPKGGR